MNPSVRNRSCLDGSALIEFALAAPLVFLLLLAVLDFSGLLFAQATLQSAVSEAVRFGITGRRLPDPEEATAFLSRAASIRAVLDHYAVGLDRPQIEVAMSDGGPLDTLEVRARYRYRLLLATMLGRRAAITLEGRAAMRNEKFPEGSP